jgi:hypothetical protein
MRMFTGSESLLREFKHNTPKLPKKDNLALPSHALDSHMLLENNRESIASNPSQKTDSRKSDSRKSQGGTD